MRPLIHRQFESKAHENRFRNAMIKSGHDPTEVDKTIDAINQKKFFTKPRVDLNSKSCIKRFMK